MKGMYKEHLLNECFDIDDLVRWTKTQMYHCERKDHLEIYKKFWELLEKVRENQIKADYQEVFGKERKIERAYQVDST